MDLLAIHGHAVVGVDQLDVVAALPQVPDQFTQRPRHAIDLGKIGFRDQCDSHIPGRDDSRVRPGFMMSTQKRTKLGSTLTKVFSMKEPAGLCLLQRSVATVRAQPERPTRFEPRPHQVDQFRPREV